jgi:hypothetical protein
VQKTQAPECDSRRRRSSRPSRMRAICFTAGAVQPGR